MAEDARFTHPLAGVVICCTSIPQDVRFEISSKATSMGALSRQDLTSEVTHLIVGSAFTPKYKYVAKNRPDVKVIDVEWVNSIHQKWINGEDVDIAEHEEKHQFPVLNGLQICVTNISDGDERTAIQEVLPLHGATYHPDLTRKVTHLIAPIPEGKKYQFARQWNIKIVTPEWLSHSIERGMVLEESLYDPTLPLELQGKGARPEPISKSTIENEDVKGAQAAARPSQIGVRRIRDKFSKHIAGHGQSIFEDILGQTSTTKGTAQRDAWEDDHDIRPAVEGNKNSARAKRTIFDDDEDEVTVIQQKQSTKTEGIFAGYRFCLYGFEAKGEEVLNETISSHGGTILSLANLQMIKAQSLAYLIVPETLTSRLQEKLNALSLTNPDMRIVSYWLIERCLFQKAFYEPIHPNNGGDDMDILYFPFIGVPVDEFGGLEITTTGLSGIEDLHVTKAIKILGAKFEASFNRHRTKMVIAASNEANSDKVLAATRFDIPVVHLKWLLKCLQKTKKLEYDEYLIKSRKRRRESKENSIKRARPDEPKPAQSKLTNLRRKDLLSSELKPQTPLKGCVIHVSQTCDHIDELQKIAAELGALTVSSLESRGNQPLTHLILPLSDSNGKSSEVTTAQSLGPCCIVSPEWLLQCNKLKRRVLEADYALIDSGQGADSRDSENKAGNATETEKVSPLVELPNVTANVRRNPFEVDDSEDGPQELSDHDSSSLTLSENTASKKVTSESTGVPQQSEAQRQSEAITTRVKRTSRKTEVNNMPANPVISELLKMDTDEISSRLEKPRRLRGRLQGRATSNTAAVLSRENTSLSTAGSGNVSFDNSFSGADVFQSATVGKKRSDEGFLFTQVQQPQSQTLTYADPEAQRQRKKMIAKLNGQEIDSPLKPAKETKGREAPDTIEPRRNTRNTRSRPSL